MASLDDGDLVLQAGSPGQLKILCNYEEGMSGELQKVHGKHKFEAGKIPVLGSHMETDRTKSERAIEVLGALETTGANWIDRADVAKLSAKVNSMDELIYEKRLLFREMFHGYEERLRKRWDSDDHRPIHEILGVGRGELIDLLLQKAVSCFGSGSKQVDYWKRIKAIKDENGDELTWTHTEWALSYFRIYDSEQYHKENLAYRSDEIHLHPERPMSKRYFAHWEAVLRGGKLPK